MKLIAIKRTQMKEIRLELLEKQNWKCLICKCELKEDKNSHTDHQHFGDKLIRGILCRRCNTLEGKLWNNYNRMTKREQKSWEDYYSFLLGLVKYYKKKPTRYVFPEVKKKRKRKPKVNKVVQPIAL